ncbi:acylphosphatase [Marinobacter salinisoli]|uniref:acylphosphatase n=1 Tax=Marinobacter salinisoli TaxID=2769486 RepID=A0ABX7MP39_9GAMM|nr:acylphosphatase [Marinobacter salinisoli]QSP93999.1 acylphosphatase [Marinobacter salinisoli]
MANKRWTLIISGKVQGVYYRASTESTANEIGVTGYARNLPDGRVEVVAEGTEEQLGKLRAWCQKGPPDARVEDIEMAEQVATGAFSGFGIRR